MNFRVVAAICMCAAVSHADSSVTELGDEASILSVCETYRRAMEARDARALVALAHPSYYDDAGTPNTDDDYGYKELGAFLQKRLDAVSGVKLKMIYRKTSINDGHATVEVLEESSFLLKGSATWTPHRDTVFIKLERSGKRWLITSGM